MPLNRNNIEIKGTTSNIQEIAYNKFEEEFFYVKNQLKKIIKFGDKSINFYYILNIIEVYSQKYIEEGKLDYKEFLDFIEKSVSDFFRIHMNIANFYFSEDIKEFLEKEMKKGENPFVIFNDIFLKKFLYFVDNNNFGQTPAIRVSDKFFIENEKYTNKNGKFISDNDEEKFKYGGVEAYFDNNDINFRFKYLKDRKIQKESFLNSNIRLYILEKYKGFLSDIFSKIKKENISLSIVHFKENNFVDSLNQLDAKFRKIEKENKYSNEITLFPKFISFLKNNNIKTINDFLKQNKINYYEFGKKINQENNIIINNNLFI